MATQQSTIDDLLELTASVGGVTARKMFGEYCVYLNDKPVALVCDDCLFVKPTEAGRELVPNALEGPPYSGAKPHLRFPKSTWMDVDLCELIRVTHRELPIRRPRTKRK